MKILDFTAAHCEQAATLAKNAYERERGFVPALPEDVAIPDLRIFAENGKGVAAFDGERMLGYLCGYGPFDHAFGSQNVKGIFSPIHAHAIADNNAKIYERMYQVAADKWVKAGARSHAIALYAHEDSALRLFFRYGFGMRCVDAIRTLNGIDCVPKNEFEFTQLPQEDFFSVFPLCIKLNEYQRTSPYFLYREPDTEESFTRSCQAENTRYFAARFGGNPVAYLKINHNDGETFIAEKPGYAHIKGAYCLSAYRERGVMQHLLDFVVGTLKAERMTMLGVDYESYNPTAWGFWRKHFSSYTYSVVRQIDENVAFCQGSNLRIIPIPPRRLTNPPPPCYPITRRNKGFYRMGKSIQ
jgi:ribosomal protein S18 acetylase RimI-like enzyme